MIAVFNLSGFLVVVNQLLFDLSWLSLFLQYIDFHQGKLNRVLQCVAGPAQHLRWPKYLFLSVSHFIQNYNPITYMILKPFLTGEELSS